MAKAKPAKPRPAWGGRTGLILATIGAAVGLGNIWRFSYVAGENGGGAFLVVYVACVALIGLPLLIAELALGRAGQADAPATFAALAPGGRVGFSVDRWGHGCAHERAHHRQAVLPIEGHCVKLS